MIQPPTSYASDLLTPHRRKWDILRITLETTVYASPPQPTDPQALPTALRDILTTPPQSLISDLHKRSTALFTPSTRSQKANSTVLPTQVLMTLILSSMKLDCPEVGRGMIEDWLARRGQGHYDEPPPDIDEEGYEKVLGMYCLHVLPRLEEWDYAREFLQYERELPQEKRQVILFSPLIMYHYKTNTSY